MPESKSPVHIGSRIHPSPAGLSGPVERELPVALERPFERALRRLDVLARKLLLHVGALLDQNTADSVVAVLRRPVQRSLPLAVRRVDEAVHGHVHLDERFQQLVLPAEAGSEEDGTAFEVLFV